MNNIISDISSIDPKQNHKDFSTLFNLHKCELEGLYSDYENKNKIINLFEYWVFNIFCIEKAYGKNGLEIFCNSKLSNPLRFSYQYEFSDDVHGAEIRISKQSKLRFALVSLFLRKVYIPGSILISLKDKVLNKISFFFIHSIPLRENKLIKSSLFDLLERLLSQSFNDNEIESIKKKLPMFFYSRKVNFFSNNIIEVEGSAASFMEYSGYEKLFLLDTKLSVTGHQHGGGYDIFKIDFFAYYEKKLCENFYGWGFSKKNKAQKKYGLVKHKATSEKRILWIEDSIIPTLDALFLSHHYYQSINKNIKNYIYTELKKINVRYSNLPHPVMSPLYEKFRRDDFGISDIGKISDNLINKNDILIFDCTGASLVHLAIENDIIFFFIISRQDYDNFTEKQKEHFLLLKKYNLGFFDYEENKFSQALLKYYNSAIVELPDEIFEYNKRIFKQD